jgi:hypothetical protein
MLTHTSRSMRRGCHARCIEVCQHTSTSGRTLVEKLQIWLTHAYRTFNALKASALAMLAYAGVCWRMLTYADVCWRVLFFVRQRACWYKSTSAATRTLAEKVLIWRTRVYRTFNAFKASAQRTRRIRASFTGLKVQILTC